MFKAMLFFFMTVFSLSCGDKKNSPSANTQEQDLWLNGEWRGLLQLTKQQADAKARTVDLKLYDDTGLFEFCVVDGGEAQGLWYENQEDGTLLFDIKSSTTSLFGRSASQKSFQYVLNGSSLKLTSERITVDLRRPFADKTEDATPTENFENTEYLHCTDYDSGLSWFFDLTAPNASLNIYRLTSEVPGYTAVIHPVDQNEGLKTIELTDHKPPLKIELTPSKMTAYQKHMKVPFNSFGCIRTEEGHTR